MRQITKGQLAISLDLKLIEQLRSMCEKENRTLSNMIETILLSALEDR